MEEWKVQVHGYRMFILHPISLIKKRFSAKCSSLWIPFEAIQKIQLLFLIEKRQFLWKRGLIEPKFRYFVYFEDVLNSISFYLILTCLICQFLWIDCLIIIFIYVSHNIPFHMFSIRFKLQILILMVSKIKGVSRG